MSERRIYFVLDGGEVVQKGVSGNPKFHYRPSTGRGTGFDCYACAYSFRRVVRLDITQTIKRLNDQLYPNVSDFAARADLINKHPSILYWMNRYNGVRVASVSVPDEQR